MGRMDKPATSPAQGQMGGQSDDLTGERARKRARQRVSERTRAQMSKQGMEEFVIHVCLKRLKLEPIAVLLVVCRSPR
eukprot:15439021-Alexandrium_andersonii.AAC.1